MVHGGRKLGVLSPVRLIRSVNIFYSALLACAVPAVFAQQTAPVAPNETTNVPATVTVQSSALIVLPTTPPPPARPALAIPAANAPLVVPPPISPELKRTPSGHMSKTLHK